MIIITIIVNMYSSMTSIVTITITLITILCIF